MTSDPTIETSPLLYFMANAPLEVPSWFQIEHDQQFPEPESKHLMPFDYCMMGLEVLKRFYNEEAEYRAKKRDAFSQNGWLELHLKLEAYYKEQAEFQRITGLWQAKHQAKRFFAWRKFYADGMVKAMGKMT